MQFILLYSTLATINIGEDNIFTNDFIDLERPLGKKATKERLNKRKAKIMLMKRGLLGSLTKMKEERKLASERKLEVRERSDAREEEMIRVK